MIIPLLLFFTLPGWLSGLDAFAITAALVLVAIVCALVVALAASFGTTMAASSGST
jgi:hypothetical protein